MMTLEKPKFPERHLGDGVYASFDGFQIWLTTGHGSVGNRIALEPPVLSALLDYRDDIDRIIEELNRGK